ncbi:MAG: bifunctional non-ous end joining protein LigD [Tepidanaerobacteraceae bacterium]|nr:bifunctional non-ous end joining protein LigD [Tepidanaerobacteraceae bacterium]
MIKPGIPFIPMEPVSHPEAFDDESYGFQVKWDGTRILAHIGGGVELFNRKMNKRTKQYPEVVGALSRFFSGKSAVLDGEMIALLGGKPDFQNLMRRDMAVDEATVKYLTLKIPVTYVVFDILYLNGKCLVDLPFSERYSMLRTCLSSSDPVVVTDTFPGMGVALFEAVKEKGLEGIVAKKLDSLYEIGKKSKKWLKIKNRRTIHCLIGGFLVDGRKLKSVIVGRMMEGELIYLGRVFIGLDEEKRKLLYDVLSRLERKDCPFAKLPPLEKREKPVWVVPCITAEVEFLDYTSEGYLRQPVFRRIENIL